MFKRRCLMYNFNRTFKINSKYEEDLVDRLSAISMHATEHQLKFDYSIEHPSEFEKNVLHNGDITVTINADWSVVCVYNKRTHIYSNELGIMESVNEDIKSVDIDCCQFCNSIRDRNEMIILNHNDTMFAVGTNCYDSINYNKLIIEKYQSHFIDEESILHHQSTPYWFAVDCYKFVFNDPHRNYVSRTTARDFHIESSIAGFESFVETMSDCKIEVDVPDNWIDNLIEFSKTLENNDFNNSLIQIIEDIKSHDGLIHHKATAMFLYFLFKYRDSMNDVYHDAVDFNKDSVDIDTTLVGFKVTKYTDYYTGLPVNIVIFKDSDNMIYHWNTTKVVDKIGNRYHLKTNRFEVGTFNNKKICKVKNLRGIK